MAITSFALVRFTQGQVYDARRARDYANVPAVSVVPAAGSANPGITSPDTKAPGTCWEIATDTAVKVKFGIKGQTLTVAANDYDAMIPANNVMWFSADAAQIIAVMLA